MSRPRRLLNPSRLLILGFGGITLLGMLALLLPSMMKSGVTNHSPIEALFQATSAVCVTGLTVRALSEYSFFGQIIILLLIQIGGIGILTFSKLALLGSHRQLQFGERSLLESSLGRLRRVSPRAVLQQTIAYTLICEAIGACALAPVFIYDFGWSAGIWAAIFHSISAFCNAGFGLWDDSIAQYAGNYWVNAVIMILVIAGGLGFIVIAELWLHWRGKLTHRMSLHTRTVLIMSAILIVGSMLVFAGVEAMNPADYGYAGHPLTSSFLAVNARTAGFSSAPIDALSQPSLMLLMALMLIGGSPGSTAGGIKTTTFATLIAMVIARARGRAEPELFGRAIGPQSVSKAIATTGAMFIAVILGTLTLEVCEVGLIPHRGQTGHFLDYGFEIVSALCTVGLSTGITADLSSPGKMVIIICMFAGRLGPLIIAGAMLSQAKPLPYSLPREELIIG